MRKPNLFKLSLRGVVFSAVATAFGVAVLGGCLAGCGDDKPAVHNDGGTCSGSFVSPADMAMLTEANDATKSCGDGFQTSVTVATSQPEGTSVDLLVGTAKAATARVAGAKVVFTGVQLAEGLNNLTASFSASCSLTAKVTVDCNLPLCSISKPAITATHPSLNGVPAANGGDRASAAGAPYQVEFDVMTDIEDAQPVQLKVTKVGATGSSTILDGSAVGGKVVFAGVNLTPDGDYTVEATCTSKANLVGHSTKGTYPVDSTAPALTIVSPADGKFFGPTELTAGAFKVCAKTADADAAGLPAALGDAVKNLSVAIGTASPDATNGFAAVTAINTDTCVNVACTSSTPVNLTVTLKDKAGNPTVKTISQISCATTLPGVAIISPPGDTTPFSDPTKHLLAATSTNTLKDQDGAAVGAQWTVVACSDKAGAATLLAGQVGGTLAAIGVPINTVAAVPADNCPNGKTQIAKFTSATIPDSMLKADGTLDKATALEVDVKDASTAVGKSPEVDLWVASVAPSVANYGADAICNTAIPSMADVTKNVTLLSSTSTVTLTVTSSTSSIPYATPAFAGGLVTFSNVVFKPGVNTLTAVATDKAGNSGTLAQPCTVSVGTPPIVTFVAPAATKNLCAMGNTSTGCIADGAATAGWQGTLTVNVTVQGIPATSGTVTFTASSATAALGTANIDGSGNASLAVTIPDGNPVTITATTSSLGTSGIGVATRILVVDTSLPAAPTTLVATVKDRRQTTFTLTWTAPADVKGTAPVAGYDIRYSKTAITAANFAAATAVPSGGSPQAPGAVETRDVPDLFIETDYYFALAATDAAGNVSSLVFSTPVRASFNQTILLGPQAVMSEWVGFGYYVDGSGNFNGDAYSDILAGDGYGTSAYLFLGAASFAAGTPAVTFTSTASGYGSVVANIGDVDGDGLEDIGIASPSEPQPKIFIFRGRATWPAVLTPADATYTITSDILTLDPSSAFGYPIVKLGDINGDGVGDFGVGAFLSGATNSEGAFVVVLGASPFGNGLLSARIAAGRAMILTNPVAPAGYFGISAVALGAQNGTLVVGAPIAASSAGRLTAYRWSGTTLAPVGTTFMGAANEQVGYVLNAFGGGAGVISGNTAGNGSIDVFFGGSGADPLAGTPQVFISNGLAHEAFGTLALGGGFSGSNDSISFLGDSRPDLVMASARAGGPSTIYILDGAQAASLPSPVEVTTAATVKIPLPADWDRVTIYESAVKDVNGDGHGDIAVGETDATGNTPRFRGRVLVLW
jgi:hypothetical protein